MADEFLEEPGSDEAEGAGTLAFRAFSAAAAFMSARTRSDAEATDETPGFQAWAPVAQAGLFALLLSVFLIFGYEDTFRHLVGGLLVVAGVVAVLLGVVGGAAVESTRPPPRRQATREGTALAVAGVSGLVRVDEGLAVVEVPAAPAVSPDPDEALKAADTPLTGPPQAGRRMVVLDVGEGGVCLWGPLRWTSPLGELVAEAGQVRVIVITHANQIPLLADWQAVWPDAVVAGGAAAVASVGAQPIDGGWRDDALVAVEVPGPEGPEVLGFHAPSCTVLAGGLVWSTSGLGPELDLRWRWLLRLGAMDGRLSPRTDWKLLLSAADREALAAAIGDSLLWPMRRILPARGRPVDIAAADAWAEAWAFLFSGVRSAAPAPRAGSLPTG